MNYKTVDGYAYSEFVEKKSKFIGYISPVNSAEQANNFISEIKTKHWDATHNCFAYIIKKPCQSKFSDDGEPSSTAGMPILQTAKNEQLENVCIVVTRYFGGTLLGAAGLVKAYSKAAQKAIEAAVICTMKECWLDKIECDYSIYARLENILRENECTIKKTDFTQTVEIFALIDVKEHEKICNKLIDASNGKVRIITEKTEFDKKV